MTKIKICGITNQKDYDDVISLGADFAGFVFYPRSPRYIAPEEAGKITSNLKGDCKRVGVFVNEEPERIKEIYKTADLDIVQLHGDETRDYCVNLKLPLWKAVRVKDEYSLNSVDEYVCDVVLLDSYSNKHYGGTGKVIEFEKIKDISKFNKKIIIAGGVSSENLAEFLQLGVYGVDISSSIESQPGIKDIQKMKRIFEIKKEFEKR